MPKKLKQEEMDGFKESVSSAMSKLAKGTQKTVQTTRTKVKAKIADTRKRIMLSELQKESKRTCYTKAEKAELTRMRKMLAKNTCEVRPKAAKTTGKTTAKTTSRKKKVA